MDDRAERQDAHELGISIMVRALVVEVWSDEAARAAMGEKLATTIEGMYTMPGLLKHAHPPIQRALDLVRETFGPDKIERTSQPRHDSP